MNIFGNRGRGGTRTRIAGVVVLLFVIMLVVPIQSIADGQNASQVNYSYAYPFRIANVSWSYSSSDNPSHLVLTVEDDGPVISIAYFTLNLTQPFTGPAGASNESSYESGIKSNTVFTLTYPIYSASTAALGNYNFTLQIDYWISDTSGYYNTTYQEALTFKVHFLGTTSVSISPSDNSLVSGEVNDVVFSIFNNGTGTLTNVSEVPSSQSQMVFLDSFPEISSLVPEERYNFTEPIYVTSSSSGVEVITFTLTFNGPSGNQMSEKNAASFYFKASPNYITVSTSSDTLTPSKTNNVTFTLLNNGSQNVTDVKVSQPSQTQLVFLKQFPVISSLNEGDSFTWTTPIYVSNGTSSALSIQLTISYSDPYGVQNSESQNLAFYLNKSSGAQNVSFSVKSVSPYVVLGLNSTASFTVTNIANQTMYSPLITISVPSSFAITGNSTFYYPDRSIEPGESITFSTLFSSSPSASAGAYEATITISYYNSTGNLHKSSFTTEFLGLPKVTLVLQDFATSASGRTLTISGTLMDEGAGSAYYLTLDVSFSQPGVNSTASTYIGEVDPNTATPFSVTITLPAKTHNGSSSADLSVEYLNYYGSTTNSTLPSQNFTLDLKSNSSTNTGTTTPKNGSNFADILIVGAVVTLASLIFVILAVRKMRKRGSEKHREEDDDEADDEDDE